MKKNKKMTKLERELLSKCIELEYSNRLLKLQLFAASIVQKCSHFEAGDIHGNN